MVEQPLKLWQSRRNFTYFQKGPENTALPSTPALLTELILLFLCHLTLSLLSCLHPYSLDLHSLPCYLVIEPVL